MRKHTNRVIEMTSMFEGETRAPMRAQTNATIGTGIDRCALYPSIPKTTKSAVAAKSKPFTDGGIRVPRSAQPVTHSTQHRWNEASRPMIRARDHR